MRRAGKLPRIGDRVIVEFGGFDHEGEVVHISRHLTPAMIEVEIWLEGADEPTRVGRTPDRVRPVERVAR